MKVAINNDWGGFGLSLKALEWLYNKNSPILEMESQDKYRGDLKDCKRYELLLVDEMVVSHDSRSSRHHPDLITVIEALGDTANGNSSKLVIIEIPDGVDYVVDDYDGRESIHEQHRSWWPR